MNKSRQENNGCAFVAVLRFIDMRDKVLTHVKNSMLEHFKECLQKLSPKNYIMSSLYVTLSVKTQLK